MSPALHTKLKELFTSMDTNGDGDLEKSEAVAFWGRNFAKENAGAMFNEVDTDNSELITFDEWMDFWNNVLATVRRPAARAARPAHRLPPPPPTAEPPPPLPLCRALTRRRTF